MSGVVDIRQLDRSFDFLTVDGIDVGFINREPWHVGGGVFYRVGTTVEGFTVAGEDIDDLVIRMVAKRLETSAVYRQRRQDSLTHIDAVDTTERAWPASDPSAPTTRRSPS